MAKRVKKDRDPRVQCECKGTGFVWSNSTLTAWRERGESGPPPDQWRDWTCRECWGAGWINSDTLEPLWEKLLASARSAWKAWRKTPMAGMGLIAKSPMTRPKMDPKQSSTGSKTKSA